ATFGGGVNKFDLRRNKFPLYHISLSDNRKSQSVYAFTRDHKKRLLLGVQSLGFGVYDMNNKTLTPFEHIDDYKPLYDLELNTIRNFTWDKKGNLWLGTRFKGLIKYSPSRKNYAHVSRRKNNNRIFKEVLRTVPDLNDRIWILTKRGFFYVEQGDRFGDNSVKPFSPRISKDSAVIENAYSDFNISKNGYLYIATHSGDIWKSETSIYSDTADRYFFRKIPRPGKNNKSLNTLFIDGKNRLWVGTNNGLETYTEDGEPIESGMLSGIKNLSLHAFEEDEKGNIIATSNKGLIYINMLTDDTQIGLYTMRNGLQANYFIKGSIFKDKDGTLFAGGHQGFNHINPLNIKDDHIQPSLVFTNLRTSRKNYYSDRAFNAENPFVLHYNDNIITLSFSSIDMRDPDNLNYAYKLEGLENKWIYVTSNNRTATYVNLKPGNYTFQLKATNANGQWSENTISLPLVVETAPYFSWWAYTLYTLAAVGVIAAIFVLYRRKIRIREALRVENIERVKSEKLHRFKLQFFTNLSHELLTPLSVLTILSDKNLNGNKDAREKDKILKRNIKILNDRIKQMLNFRKAETGNMELNISWQDISGIVYDLKKDYEVLAEEKGIDFKVKVQHDLTGYIDLEKIKICMNNLLSNAFKYTPVQGSVIFELHTQGYNGKQGLIISVADTGKGIPRDDLERIFDRYYRPKSVQGCEDGLGIGLALTHHLVKIQQGTIGVESETGVGTRFKITVPIGKDISGLKNRRQSGPLITEKNIRLPEDHKTSHKPEDVEYSGKTILLVEDNEDYLELVQSYLRNYYKVFSCLDGKSALQLANREEIDLIVSDLRIPDMNGHELCRAVKNDVNTSHIPVVIVTAHADDEERKKGYEAGVDTYFSKPISLDVLVYRIESLLKKRENVYHKFNRGQFLEPEKIVSTSIDEEFLTKAKKSVENRMSESDFSVKVLCRDLGMSNSMFYRKIKGILDLTPNEFIKNIRLRRAAQLLADNNIHISEVAYMIGFNDLSYFSACFKKQYGASPSAYRKKTYREQKQASSSIQQSIRENDEWEKFNDN
ncbi:hybrid sensor histidine kinase/response regulator transcription factor, partial [Sinomicrobium weinanense]